MFFLEGGSYSLIGSVGFSKIEVWGLGIWGLGIESLGVCLMWGLGVRVLGIQYCLQNPESSLDFRQVLATLRLFLV